MEEYLKALVSRIPNVRLLSAKEVNSACYLCVLSFAHIWQTEKINWRRFLNHLEFRKRDKNSDVTDGKVSCSPIDSAFIPILVDLRL